MKTIQRTIFAVLMVAALTVSAGGATTKSKVTVKRPPAVAHPKTTLSAFALLPLPRPARTLPNAMQASGQMRVAAP